MKLQVEVVVGEPMVPSSLRTLFKWHFTVASSSYVDFIFVQSFPSLALMVAPYVFFEAWDCFRWIQISGPGFFHNLC